MVPIHRDPWFVFAFEEARRVDRFRLEGVPPGRQVVVRSLGSLTGSDPHLLARGRTGTDGWVDLAEPLVVRAGEGFRAVPEPDYRLRPETPEDRPAIRHVHRAAFGREDEADLVDALRDAGDMRLGLLAESSFGILGHVVFGNVAVAGATTARGLALAPVAVLPDFQGLGIGSVLIRHGMETCRGLGFPFVLVLGEPGFYRRFGFRSDSAAPIASPFPREAFQAAELTPGGLTSVAGTVRYPPAFGLE